MRAKNERKKEHYLIARIIRKNENLSKVEEDTSSMTFQDNALNLWKNQFERKPASCEERMKEIQ